MARKIYLLGYIHFPTVVGHGTQICLCHRLSIQSRLNISLPSLWNEKTDTAGKCVLWGHRRLFFHCFAVWTVAIHLGSSQTAFFPDPRTNCSQKLFFVRRQLQPRLHQDLAPFSQGISSFYVSGSWFSCLLGDWTQPLVLSRKPPLSQGFCFVFNIVQLLSALWIPHLPSISDWHVLSSLFPFLPL